jgi:uncharacterized membrane protein
MNPYYYILGTLAFTVYGQMILKWRISVLQVFLPENFSAKLGVLLRLLIDPYIFSGFLAAFLAALCWMGAMTKFELTKVYPFMSLAPALVFMLGILVLRESFTLGKVLGLILIMTGTFITVKL